VGKTLGGATTALAKAHCRVGTLSRAYSKQKKGKVIAQHPSAGVKLRANAKVDLVLSKGRKPHRRHPR
jgi:beta-lactam-binding protein with PASTA domain